jgi:hypothetical protein
MRIAVVTGNPKPAAGAVAEARTTIRSVKNQ